MTLLPMVSVIVPVYKVEKYINKCVYSLINQTYQNKEIILVDDGGDDLCPKICENFADKYEFIKVIHKVNGGLSDARNAGIDIANGKFLFFVDSDDYISPDTLKIMVDVAINNNAEIVECSVIPVDENSDNPFKNIREEFKTAIYNHDSAVENIINYNFKIMAWNKLYQKQLFNEIRFPVGKLHEDEFTIPYIIDKCSTYCTIDAKLYAYVQRDNSIMSAKFDDRRLDFMEAQQRRIDYFGGKYPGKYDMDIMYHYFVDCIEFKVIMGNQYKGSVVEKKINELCHLLLKGKNSFKFKLKIIAYIFFPKILTLYNKRKIGKAL